MVGDELGLRSIVAAERAKMEDRFERPKLAGGNDYQLFSVGRHNGCFMLVGPVWSRLPMGLSPSLTSSPEALSAATLVPTGATHCSFFILTSSF